jgi:hypothetical protein
MSDSTPSHRVSRRAIFGIAGTGVALASIATLWRSRGSGAEAAPPGPQDGPIAYADHEGWMVTPEEKASLAAAVAAANPR